MYRCDCQVYRRYLKLEPTHAEEFITYLKIKQLWGEAARVGGRSGGSLHALQPLRKDTTWEDGDGKGQNTACRFNAYK